MLRSIAGWDEELAPNAIEVYVSRLRAKLLGTGVRISTIRSVGYRLEQPPDTPFPDPASLNEQAQATTQTTPGAS